MVKYLIIVIINHISINLIKHSKNPHINHLKDINLYLYIILHHNFMFLQLFLLFLLHNPHYHFHPNY